MAKDDDRNSAEERQESTERDRPAASEGPSSDHPPQSLEFELNEDFLPTSEGMDEATTRPDDIVTRFDAMSTSQDQAGSRRDEIVTRMDGGSAGDHTPSPAGALCVGDKLGKYEIRKRIGQGGMGTVYLAFDPMIEREVAIKVLPPHIAGQPRALERFLSEARATGKLNHPHVVGIYDIGEQEQMYYIVMELLRGGCVAELMSKRSTLDWREASRLTAEASEGLAAAHAAGFIHRDVKPENLMLTENGSVKVVDFGLSKLIDATQDPQSNLTSAGQILGTPYYMSPEQVLGKPVDARSDVYGLGAAYHYLLTGQLPFGKGLNLIQLMMAHVKWPRPDPCLEKDDVPKICGQIVAKAMATDPEHRYRDAGELAVAIRAALDGSLQSQRDDESTSVKPQVAIDSSPAAATSVQYSRVVIVEPSRVQAMVLSDAVRTAGATTVEICHSVSDATRLVDENAPGLLITAMELADGTGADLVVALRSKPHLADTVLVVNSNNSRLEDLLQSSQPGTIAAVSKQLKPAIWLNALSCCLSSSSASEEEWGVSGDQLASQTLALVGETARLPEPLAELVREMGVLDVRTCSFDQLVSQRQISDDVQFAVALRSAKDAIGDAMAYTQMLKREGLHSKVAIAVQVDGDRIQLRGMQMAGFAVSLRCELNVERLRRLCQFSAGV